LYPNNNSKLKFLKIFNKFDKSKNVFLKYNYNEVDKIFNTTVIVITAKKK